MSLLLLVLCFIDACVAPPAFCVEHAAVADSKTEWLLEQRHHVSGFHVFKFTPTSVAVRSKQIGWHIVSQAPDWGVTAYRLDDKVKYMLSRKGFYRNRGFYPKRNRMTKYTFIGTNIVGPLRVNVYSGPTQEVWVARIPGIPEEVEGFIIAYHEARPVYGLPLKGMTYPVNGPERKDTSIFSMNHSGAEVTVETLTLKKIPYNAADFAVPKGLREVAGMEEVMASKSKRKDAEMVLEEMGVGEALGSSRKK